MLTKDRKKRPTVDKLLLEPVIQDNFSGYAPLDLLERDDLNPEKALLDFQKNVSQSTQDQTYDETFEKDDSLFGRSDSYNPSVAAPQLPDQTYDFNNEKSYNFD